MPREWSIPPSFRDHRCIVAGVEGVHERREQALKRPMLAVPYVRVHVRPRFALVVLSQLFDEYVDNWRVHFAAGR